jgi:signal transduction histidine kinase
MPSRTDQAEPRALLRLGLPLLLLAALMALEVARGARRMGELQARHERDLLDLVARQQARLAQEVEGLIGEGEGHARYLARAPFVHDLLARPDAQSLAALERALLPYVAGFRGLDRISVLDADGRELARCERMGGGVAVLPAARLSPAPQAELLRLAGTVAPGDVAVSPLLDDAERVEVSAAERPVFHCVAPVLAPRGTPGAVAVTAYAAPLLRALREFEPLPGTASFLLDARGAVFAAPDQDQRAAALDARALAGAADGPLTAVPGATLLATPIASGPAARLVTSVPAAALERASGLSTGERLGAASTSALTLIAIAVVSALFVRQGLRAARLREAESFLARLRDESRRNRALMEAAADVLLVLEPRAGRVRDWNAPAGELFGLGAPPEAGAGGVPLSKVGSAFAEESREALRAALTEALQRPGTPVERPELRMASEAAGERVLDLRCIAVDYGGEPLVEAALLDRTREREMERRMQTAERLSSLGLLTAGVAHEINNPLEGIVNYVALLERGGGDETRRAHYLRQVRAGLERIGAIVGDLLRFSRSAPEEGELDLALVVDAALSLAALSRQLSGVRVEREGLAAPLRVEGSARRIEQVLLNLILNAGRAMDGRGSLWLRARRAPDGFAELAVEDDGPGIAAQDLPHLFDPFFSRSGSTGLGLAVSYGIVRAVGGELSAENRPERGARFLLRLRLAQQKSERQAT